MNAETIHARPLALTLVWDNSRLLSLGLHWSDSPGLESEAPTLSPYAAQLKRCLVDYVAGKKVRWRALPEESFESAGLTEFSRRVLETLRREVPHGQVTTYGRLAAMAGQPGAARAVGRIMAGNPWPILYPCHRVIGVGGKLVGFGGGAAGLPMKEYLLRLEGALE